MTKFYKNKLNTQLTSTPHITTIIKHNPLEMSSIKPTLLKGNINYFSTGDDPSAMDSGHDGQQVISTKSYPDFNLPRVNFNRNTKRFISVMSMVKLFVKMLQSFDSGIKGFLQPLSKFIFNMEQLYKSDPHSFVSLSKLYQNWFKVSFLSGDFSQRNIPNGLWNRSSQSPYILSDLIDMVKRIHDIRILNMVVRIILTILSAYKVIVVPSEPNLDTIQSPYTGIDNPENLFDFNEILTRLNLNPDYLNAQLVENVMSSKWHYSSASGPNGDAVWSSHLDALAIHRDQELYTALESYCKDQNMDYVINALNDCNPERLLNSMDSITEPIHSKLHFIFEKGNKTRIIAILDYFTQEILTPLHNVLADYLKTNTNDFTFNQDLGFDTALKWSSDLSRNEMFSYDLSAATDRLPIVLQARILEELFSSSLASNWVNIIQSRSFILPNSQPIKYSVGQPMGMKSSFPMLALTHHFIVQQAAINAGLPFFNNYIILGDDIVINSKSVAEKYYDLINKLGLEISIHKSVIPSSDQPGFEFASRIGKSGFELSPLPVKLLANAYEDSSYLPELQNQLERLGFKPEIYWYRFIASFVSKTDLQENARLNGLPTSVNGLIKSIPNTIAPDLNFDNWSRQFRLSELDLSNMLTYMVITDQMKRIDQMLSSSTSTLSAILSWAKSSGYKPIKVVMGNIRFEDFIAEVMSGSEGSFFHPVQEIARSEANRLTDILSQLMLSEGDMVSKIRKGLIQSIHTQLEQKDRMGGDTVHSSGLYNRRLIEKTLRTLVSICSTDRSRKLVHTIKIQSIDQTWTIQYVIGESLVVSPLRVTNPLSESEVNNKLETSLKGVTFANSIFSSVTPEEKRKYHPGNRLTSS